MIEGNLLERISNLLLILYTIRETKQIGKMDDSLKLQKLTFISQKNMVRSRIKALDYQFHRWDMGPFSAGVSADLDILLALKLVHPGWPIQLSKQGENLLKTCNDLLVLNKQSVGYIDRVIRKYGHLDSESIKKKVYDFTIALPKTHEIMKIRDIPKGTPILFKTSTKNAKVKFEMDDSWLTTLEIAFNQEIIDSIAEAYDDAREGRVDEFRSIRTS